jgi:ABC-type multidrug transport system ATPase subunit
MSVTVERVTVQYGGRPALDSVSFTVEPGATLALLGRNGGGKTSLVRCLLGQQRPQEGTVRLFGRDVWRERARLMDRVGVVPEESDLPPELTAEAVIHLCGALYRRWDAGAIRSRLHRLDVPMRTPNARLSKGQRAQLALSLALGHEPELLVLDDPTLGLDAIARRAFFGEVIDELAGRGMTMLITSHDLAGVERIASRVVILNGGKVVLDDELEAVKAAFRRLPDGSASLEDIFAAVVDGEVRA